MGYTLTYFYLLSFVAMIVFATALALARPLQPSSRLRVLLASLVAVWALIDFLSNTAQIPEQLERLAYAAAPVWAALPFTLLLTTLVYTEWPAWTRSRWVRAGLALPAMACVYLVHAGLLYHQFLPASVNGHYFQWRSTGWQAYVTAYCILYSGLAIAVLWGAARQQLEERFRATGTVLLGVVASGVVATIAMHGGLSPLGVNPPYLGSVLCTLVGVVLGLGTLRRDLAPASIFRRQLDAARDDLTRRDEILSALPIGVAIVDPSTHQILYSNALFKSLAEMGTVGLSSTLRTVVRRPSKAASGTSCELSMTTEGSDRTLLVTVLEVHYGGRPVDLVTARDITSTRKLEREIEQQRERLAQVQKMEAVGRLSAGIAHDFNNQLSVIVTNASVMHQTLGDDDRYRMDLDEIFSAVERGRQLTSQLLAFSRKQAPSPEVVDINTVLLRLERILQRLLGSGITLLMRTSTTPALVRIDRSHIEQVILALATNAADAMPERGTLTCEVSRSTREGDREEQIVLEVRDTGCGIESEVIDRVFEPFFSTKGKLGTGLGLATAYGYLRSAGAAISVASEVGKGTTFTLRFAAARIDREEAPVLEDASVSPKPPIPLTILMVDDEDAVRRSLSRVLRQRGHRVLEASSAEEAIALFDREQVSILVTDIAMPDTDGRTLAEELQKKCPSLPVLFMSGHLREQERLRDRSVAFIAKPFLPDVLLEKVEQLIPMATTSSPAEDESRQASTERRTLERRFSLPGTAGKRSVE